MKTQNKQNIFQLFREVDKTDTQQSNSHQCSLKLVDQQPMTIQQNFIKPGILRANRKSRTFSKFAQNKSALVQRFNTKHQVNFGQNSLQKSGQGKLGKSAAFLNKTKKCLSNYQNANSTKNIPREQLFNMVYQFLQKLISQQNFQQKVITQMKFTTKNNLTNQSIKLHGSFHQENDSEISKTVSIQCLDHFLNNLSDQKNYDQNSNPSKESYKLNVLAQISELQSQTLIPSCQRFDKAYDLQGQQGTDLQDNNHVYKDVSLMVLSKQCSFFQIHDEMNVSLKVCSEMASSELISSNGNSSSSHHLSQMFQKVCLYQLTQSFIQNLFQNGDQQPQPFLINLSLCLLVKYIYFQGENFVLNKKNIILLLSLSTCISYKIYYDLPIGGLMGFMERLVGLSFQDIRFSERTFLRNVRYQLNITNQQYYTMLSLVMQNSHQNQSNQTKQ